MSDGTASATWNSSAGSVTSASNASSGGSAPPGTHARQTPNVIATIAESYSDDEDSWIFMMTADIDLADSQDADNFAVVPGQSSFRFILDSGAAYHVAPPSFGIHFPLEPMQQHIKLRSASGQVLEILGMRKVAYRITGLPLKITSTFIICDVKHVLMSIPQLTEHRNQVLFNNGPTGCVLQTPKGSVDVPRYGRLHALEVTLVDGPNTYDLIAEGDEDMEDMSPMERAMQLGEEQERRVAAQPGIRPGTFESETRRNESETRRASQPGTFESETRHESETRRATQNGPQEQLGTQQDALNTEWEVATRQRERPLLLDETQAMGIASPQLPSAEEIAAHSLTHIPYRAWCKVCVATKGRDNHHSRVEDRVDNLTPVIQADYWFLEGETRSISTSRTFIVMVDTSSGAVHTNECLTKGPGCSYSVAAAKSFLMEIGHARIILQTDGEPAILAWAEEVRRAVIGDGHAELVALQASPVDSHGSNGAAERAVALIRNQAKALIYQLEMHMQHAHLMGWNEESFTVPRSSPLWTWASRHAAWSLNRFQRRRGLGNITAYEKYKGRLYQQPLVCFAQTVMSMRPGAHLHKSSPSKLQSVWLGRDTLTDTHIVATAAGLYRTRAVRALPDQQSWCLPLLKAMVWTPWKTSMVGPGRRPLAAPGEPFVPAPLPTSDAAHAPAATQGAGVLPAPASVPTGAPTQSASTTAADSGPAPVAPAAAPAAAAASSAPAPVAPAAAPAAAAAAAAAAPPVAARRGPGRPRKDPLNPSLVQAPHGTKRSAETPAEAMDPRVLGRPLPALPAASSSSSSAMPVAVPAPALAPVVTAPVAPVAAPAPASGPTNIVLLCELAEEMVASIAEVPHEETYQEGRSYEELRHEARKTHLKKLVAWNTYKRDSIARVRGLGHNILSIRWVDSGTVEVKCRMTARGYEQEDSDHMFFSATPNSSMLKVLLTLAAVFGWSVEIGDAESAFLQADYEGDVWLYPPKEAEEDVDVCWKVLKIIPGLRGGPRFWGNHATSVLEDLGFTRNAADECCYSHREQPCHLLRHMDDFVGVGPLNIVDPMFKQMTTALNMGSRASLRGPGDKARILGIEVTRRVGGFEVTTKAELYDQILEDEFPQGYANARPTKLPAEKEKIPTEEQAAPVPPHEHSHFRTQIGRFLFGDAHRGDSQWTTRRLARHVQAPRVYDLERLHRLCRYLVGNRNLALMLFPTGKKLFLEGYGDSDWAGCLETRRSTSGGVLYLNGATVLTYSRLQATPALSSCEAELNALTTLASEALFLREILLCMGFTIPPPVLYSDSQSGLHVTARQGLGGKLKHLTVKELAIQSWVERGRIVVRKCKGTRNPADYLTKLPTTELFQLGMELTGLRPPASTSSTEP